MPKRTNYLEKIYYFILLFIAGIIIATPIVIREGVSFLEEEYVEMALIAVLMEIGYFIVLIYRNELHRRDRQLDETFKYIGELNVRLQYIKSFFTDIKQYPESKKDFKQILILITEKILGITNGGWVFIRIVDTHSEQTMAEHMESRPQVVVLHHEISNQSLIAGKDVPDCSVVDSGTENVFSQVFCVIPKNDISEEQKIFIKAILNQLQMLFIIFSSKYYKESAAKSFAKPKKA